MEIKWYMWLVLWAVKTQKSVDISYKKSIKLTTTMYYKEYNGVLYIVETTYQTEKIRTKGKTSRRQR